MAELAFGLEAGYDPPTSHAGGSPSSASDLVYKNVTELSGGQKQL